MSLGVLNNINAIYAENNLNNTSSSLSKVLNQLSSGSKINSGADDAAGLSLVDGLQANATSLTQSATNATEGVGMLQVADGALSQVTNLLNRAVTLATEVSNGTLNASQNSAANQEYQSILSEITNIGSTTTYNQQKVFGGSDVNIYTGDSSTTGASIDSLHFAAVSSSSVGDAGGTMQYSSGSDAFIDLSKGATTAASANTAISALGGTADGVTLSVYDPTTGTSTNKFIAPTSASETLSEYVAQINSGGYGVTASITTASAAGDAADAGDIGISIAGNVTTTGSGPSSATGAIKVASTFEATGQSSAPAATAYNSTSESAMISYTAGSSATSSVNLSTTNLSSQASAESALTQLNLAITDVAAQDGYIGSQINTLNSVSSVLTTQQENVTSAQNAVQATDYASASSAMSKYEILNQTGISALAQANSVQQEVIKLLQ